MFDAGHLNEAFHTALRKAVDNTESVASWNMLNFMDTEITVNFFGHIAALLKEDYTAADLRRIALDWEGETGSLGGKAYQCRTFLAILKLHPHSDWTAISQFMRHCGIGPEVDWAVDERSYGADVGGFKVKVEIVDEDGNPLAAFSGKFKSSDGHSINGWYGRNIATGQVNKDGGFEVLPEILDRVRTDVVAMRWEFAEAKARPEALVERADFDLTAQLDPSDPVEKQIIDAFGVDTVVIARRPHRTEGVDRMSYMIAVPKPDNPFGYEFRTAGMYKGEFKSNRSTLQRWSEEGELTGNRTLALGQDDDLIGTVIHVSVNETDIGFRIVMDKRGLNAGVLSEREILLPIRRAVEAVPAAV